MPLPIVQARAVGGREHTPCEQRSSGGGGTGGVGSTGAASVSRVAVWAGWRAGARPGSPAAVLGSPRCRCGLRFVSGAWDVRGCDVRGVGGERGQ
jgi:hypothetical protein